MDWYNREELIFRNEKLGHVDFNSIHSILDSVGEFAKELSFMNCDIDGFSAHVVRFTEKVVFKNCSLKGIHCHATYFIGGLEISECTVMEDSQFDSGGHNNDPNVFLIQNSIFEGYVNFSDIFCEGPVNIMGNEFKAGTNLNLHMTPPHGVKSLNNLKIEGNTGELCIEMIK